MVTICDCLTFFVIILVTLSYSFIPFVDCQPKREGEWKRLLPWAVSQYPNPWKDPRRCGRNIPAFICDPDKLLTTDQSSIIDKILWEYGRNSICLCDSCSFANNGITIGVALLEDADVMDIGQDRRYEGTKPTWPQFADKLRKNWSLGACDNDLVMVISPSGGALSFGAVTAKILEGSPIKKLTSSDFPKSRDELVKFINEIIGEIHSYDLMKVGPLPDLRSTKPTLEPSESTEDENSINTPGGTLTIKGDSGLLIAGSSLSSPGSVISTQSANTYIAAAEDDEFKVPEDKKMSSSLAFMIVGSLTVILVSLIALFFIIWYYRTKTGNIEPNTVYTKPATEEKAPTDIKAVKYEPCKTDEPGLPV